MILVTGCGPIGYGLVQELNKDQTAKGYCEKENPEVPRGFETYDIMDSSEIERLVKADSPKVVIITEEVSSLEYCEENRMDAMHVNTRGARYFIDAAVEECARIVYVSTSYVFDGRKEGGMYTENDLINPINVYGETKLMGEVHTDKTDNFLIPRVGEVYGYYPGNFAKHVYDTISTGDKIELARDMYFSPIYIDDAVEAIRFLTVNGMSGRYNVAGPERMSHYEFGRRIAEAFGMDEELIVPVSMEELNLTVRMPRDLSLDISKIAALVKIRDAGQGLEAMKSEMKE